MIVIHVILFIGLRLVNLFLLPSSYAASTLGTGSYQVGSEELIEPYVFVLETYGLDCENHFLKVLSLILYTLYQSILKEPANSVSKRNYQTL